MYIYIYGLFLNQDYRTRFLDVHVGLWQLYISIYMAQGAKNIKVIKSGIQPVHGGIQSSV